MLGAAVAAAAGEQAGGGEPGEELPAGGVVLEVGDGGSVERWARIGT